LICYMAGVVGNPIVLSTVANKLTPYKVWGATEGVDDAFVQEELPRTVVH
jgi:hypothetical protein